MIYLLKSNNYYKVGYAKDIASRLNAYKTHNPDFELIGYKHGDKTSESKWHEFLKGFRKDDTEWFNITDEEVGKQLVDAFTNIDEITFYKLEPYEEEYVNEEVYDMFTIAHKREVFTYYLTNKALYRHNKLTNKIDVLQVDNIKTFRYENDYETYHGILINNEVLLYQYQRKGTSYNPLSCVSLVEENNLYNICTFEDFEFEV